MQPAKSELVFLNTVVALSEFEDIPILLHKQTTRYLGYQVRTEDLVDANWALRIRNVRKRLAIAASLSTSVAVRIMLLNAIMLPAVLFTVAVFRLPQWMRAKLHNMQKQFCGSTPRLLTVADTKSTQICCARREERVQEDLSPLTSQYACKAQSMR